MSKGGTRVCVGAQRGRWGVTRHRQCPEYSLCPAPPDSGLGGQLGHLWTEIPPPPRRGEWALSFMGETSGACLTVPVPLPENHLVSLLKPRMCPAAPSSPPPAPCRELGQPHCHLGHLGQAGPPGSWRCGASPLLHLRLPTLPLACWAPEGPSPLPRPEAHLGRLD